MEEKYEGGSNGRRCHKILKGEQIKKASRVEESLRGIKLPQTKIKTEESVEVHVEEEISKEDFCDSMKVANHQTIGSLENNSYGFNGSLFSLLGDHCVKFQEEVVEHFQYVWTSLDTYEKNLEKILVDKPLLVVKGLLKHLWHGLKFLFVEISFKTYLKGLLVSNSFIRSVRSSCCRRSLKTKSLMWGMIPNFLDSFVGKFLVKKFEGYLCSLIEDLLDKSIRRIVETYSYMIPSFEFFVVALKGIGPFGNHFLNLKVQLENFCDDHKFLIGLEVLKAFLIETILGLQFYLLHFEKSMFLLICENKKNSGVGVLKVFHIVFVILRKNFLELFLMNFVEEYLCYFKNFIEMWWKICFYK
ncbi:hypothetical protein M9H77_22038 [Catharanthus roseus]|uniref:Uncharacterized protein n=1 Tax=Catharanthus roseus TaxID=4058 RepID=A0ACC0AQT8_CATRO|nr:hypothetical protein M9H77_22038 [Catharanthus roseus]